MKDNRSVGKSLTMISQVSISMLVPIFLCCMLGMFLEDKFGWPAFIPLFILGALAGMRKPVLHKNQSDHLKHNS